MPGVLSRARLADELQGKVAGGRRCVGGVLQLTCSDKGILLGGQTGFQSYLADRLHNFVFPVSTSNFQLGYI